MLLHTFTYWIGLYLTLHAAFNRFNCLRPYRPYLTLLTAFLSFFRRTRPCLIAQVFLPFLSLFYTVYDLADLICTLNRYIWFILGTNPRILSTFSVTLLSTWLGSVTSVALRRWMCAGTVTPAGRPVKLASRRFNL